jgi:hypothetical protein
VSGRDARVPRTVNCYVEEWQNPAHGPDLRLREKLTKRLVRILTDDLSMAGIAPMANLLADSYAHQGGLVDPLDESENVAISGTVLGRSGTEIGLALDIAFSIKVNISTIGMAYPPVSVWCYVEEYPGEGRRKNVRLREKVTGRKVEMWGTEKTSLAIFLSSPRFSGAARLMPNLYERQGFDDYVLVSGRTTVDSRDSIRFADGDALTYLLGPTPDTAYRDAFRAMNEEPADRAHARTARAHLHEGRYREAILSARLAVEMACGGDGAAIKRRLANASADVTAAADALYEHRKVAVHEGGTRVEQQDAEQAVEAMQVVLAHLESERASA